MTVVIVTFAYEQCVADNAALYTDFPLRHTRQSSDSHDYNGNYFNNIRFHRMLIFDLPYERYISVLVDMDSGVTEIGVESYDLAVAHL